MIEYLSLFYFTFFYLIFINLFTLAEREWYSQQAVRTCQNIDQNINHPGNIFSDKRSSVFHDERDCKDRKEVVFDIKEAHTFCPNKTIKYDVEEDKGEAEGEMNVKERSEEEQEQEEKKQQEREQKRDQERDQEQELELEQRQQEELFVFNLSDKEKVKECCLSIVKAKEENEVKELEMVEDENEDKVVEMVEDEKGEKEVEMIGKVKGEKEVEMVDELVGAPKGKHSDHLSDKKEVGEGRNDMGLRDEKNEKKKRKPQGKGQRKGKGRIERGNEKMEGEGKREEEREGRRESEEKSITNLSERLDCDTKIMKVKITGNNSTILDRKSPYRFLFGGGNEEEVFQAKKAVEMLGGSVIFPIESKFDESCTHLILWEVKRTEKYLCACSAGKVSDIYYFF